MKTEFIIAGALLAWFAVGFVVALGIGRVLAINEECWPSPRRHEEES